MSTRATMFMVMAWSLLAATGPLRGQEVNSDVKIPAPREIVAGAPAVSGLVTGPASLFAVPSQVFQGVVAQTALGALSEADARDQLGNFMSSLLVRAGVITFDGAPAGALVPTATQASSEKLDEKPDDGSRPAWSGPTPMALSASLTLRAASARRR